MPERSYTYYTYILSNHHRTTFYIGVTNDIKRRTLEHKAGTGSVFSAKYKLKSLLYYERHGDIRYAIQREKQLKNWHREWKISLIKEANPYIEDIAREWYSIEEIEAHRLGFIDIRDPETSSG